MQNLQRIRYGLHHKWYSYFHNGSHFHSSCPWGVITCPWHIDGSFPLAECLRSCSKNQEMVRLYLLSIGVQPVKSRSHDPVSRIRLLVPKIGRRRSDGPISKFRFCWRLLSFKKGVCSIFICFSQNYGSVWEGHFYCFHTIRFSEPIELKSSEWTCKEAICVLTCQHVSVKTY